MDSRSLLPACRELLESHPESLRIREQVEALEEALPQRPGVVVSFCRAIIETTCKTILADHSITIDSSWEAPKLLSEALKYSNLGQPDSSDTKLKEGAEKLVRGLNSIVDGVTMIRNVHGSAAHGSDAYEPLLDGRYAEIIARATDAVVGLLFKSHLRKSQYDPLSRFRYGDHPTFDRAIDEEHDPFLVFGTPLVPSEAFFRTDFDGYRTALIEFLTERGKHEEADEPAETSEPEATTPVSADLIGADNEEGEEP